MDDDLLRLDRALLRLRRMWDAPAGIRHEEGVVEGSTLLVCLAVDEHEGDVGVSEVAARHAGVRVRRIKFLLFVGMGLMSGLAGLMTASRLASVRYDLAAGGELQMVLMVMLGGAYIFGGRGSIAGTFLAAWLLAIIATGMNVANIVVTSQLVVMGLLLIFSIIATNAIYARTQR